jgi:DnaK suppressor protein
MAKKSAVPKKKTAARKTVKKVAPKSVSRTASKAVARKSAAKSKGLGAVKSPVKPKGYGLRELNSFKSIILEKRKEILDELQLLKESMMDVTTGEYATENSTYSMHMEQGTDAMEREKTFLFASREGKFLNYLEDALKRIEKRTYGFCTDCGKLIERERLEAVPHAQLCVRCKMKKGR